MSAPLPAHTSTTPFAGSLARLARLCLAACLAASPGIAGAAEDPDALREANRVLEEEIKLAAKPQIYLLLDLPANAMSIKGRGIELHRFPIVAWRASTQRPLGTVFRLQARPPVARPKAALAENPEQVPIELKDMPVAFELQFDPPLTLWIAPPPTEGPWGWVKSRSKEWWSRVRSWVASDASANAPHLRLTLSTDDARSLAWSVTEGLPLLIIRSRLN
ncbi:MAG: hypothetical protein AB1555_03780 [Nitrospirota bacterium]